jgi:hypothetical protein
MERRTWTAFAMMLALAAAGCAADSAPAAEQDHAEGMDAMAGGVSGADMMDALLTQTETAEEKIMGLAQALPESAYAWRPMDGTRSTAEVFIHVAADNYFIPAIMGVEAPAETGITLDYSTVQAYEAQDLTKEQILEILAASFEHLDYVAEQTRGDLSVEVSFGNSSWSMGGIWTMAITHLHEHLGQLIAYSRANEVAPPWSM